ncbi:MAG: hypothetical protein JXX28_01000 [Deltaproteobacteria bacterium]|nr:hypothetical protein [Deltaproteobacteria bacterium]
MSWTEHDTDLSAGALAVIVAGMREVALADGEVHPAELALIQGLADELPAGVALPEVGEAITTDAVRQIYLRSLVMVGMADGALSPVEEGVILALAERVGLGEEAVAATTLEVKREFLSAFSGVTVFRESVKAIAEELGLPADAE